MFQKITLVGRLGREPEMRFAPSGTPVVNFSVATDRKYKKDDATETETIWFNVEGWGRVAEVCNEYLHKGNLVFIEGRMKKPRVWQGQDGEHRCNLEVVIETVKFLSSKGANGGEEPAETAEQPSEEIPF